MNGFRIGTALRCAGVSTAAAVVALAVVAVVAGWPTPGSLLVAMLVVVLVGAVGGYFPSLADGPRPERRVPERRPGPAVERPTPSPDPDPVADQAPWADQAQPDGSRHAAPDRSTSGPATAPEPTAALLPLPGGSWWQQTAPAHADRPTARAVGATPAVLAPRDLADLGHRTLLARCPGCGGTRIDVHHRGEDALAFQCTECPAAWTWRQGAPWPATTARPARRAIDRSRQEI